MFQILEFTEARLATKADRVEHHGDDEKPGVSLGFELTTHNSILDTIDPTLKPMLYKTPDSQVLPGVEDALTVLRCNSVERVLLPTKHEGWRLSVDNELDETKPMGFGSCKVDKFSVEPKQGGSVVLRFRVGTSDLDAARMGMLGMHIGQSIWITLLAPKPGEKPIDGTKAAFEKDHPDATDLFAGDSEGPGDDEDDDEGSDPDVLPQDLEDRVQGAIAKSTLSTEVAWPFPNHDRQFEAPPQSATVEREQTTRSPAGSRTARGREQTKAALAAGAPKAPAKYRNADTGDTWAGKGVMPKWLKVQMERGKKLSDFQVGA